MRKLKLIVFSILICSALGSLAYAQSTTKQSMTVERIIDGDTFVASGVKIRLWGIDAPEKDHPVSYAAALYLETLLGEGNLSCEFVDIDRYERSVMKCFVDNNDIARSLVRFGMATDYKRYSKGYYDFEENIAKKNHSGLWKYEGSKKI